MYKNTNCFHLAIPCGDLETAKKFYSETLGCRLVNSAQEWADVDFWGNELTLHASEHKLDSERHDVDMGNVSVPHFGVHLSRKDFNSLKERLNKIYSKHTGKSIDEISEALERDNFMTADEAKKFGLIDSVVEKRK